jgi:hypothetical protein
MKERTAVFRSLSGLAINLSAGWFAIVFVAPSSISILSIKDVLTLIYDLLFGIIFLFISYKFEKALL